MSLFKGSKEKAKEIFDKMYFVDDIMGNYPMCHDTAKQCAIISVTEILDFLIVELKWDKKHNGHILYWQEVKQEICDL